jgi:hypothetical protein
MMSVRRRLSLSARDLRDLVLFIFSIGGLTYEAFQGSAANVTLIVGFFGLLGAPAFIRSDEHRRRQDPPDED